MSSDNNRPSEPEELKKYLAKQLNEWKTNFKATHEGQGPAQTNIEEDPIIKAVFDEFSLLKKGTHPLQQQQSQAAEATAPTENSTINNNNTNAEAPSPTHENKPTDPEELKKYLAKKLNEWKTNFKATHDGTGPTQADIEADPETKAVFDEFSQLKKGTHHLQQQLQEEQQPPKSEAEASAAPPQHQHEVEAIPPPALAVQDEQPAPSKPTISYSESERPSEPEDLKKFLTKLLNEWKTNFKTANSGSGPGQSDIESDPAVKAVFDEFSQLKKGTHPLQQQKQPEPEEPVAAAVVAPVQEEEEKKNKPTEESNPAQVVEEPLVAAVPPPPPQTITIQFSEAECPSEPEDLKKFYTKLLNDWKTEWKTAHDGKGPGQSDIESDAAVKFVFDEFSLLKKGTHPLQQQKQPEPEEPAAVAVPVEQEEHKQPTEKEQNQPTEDEKPPVIEPEPPAADVPPPQKITIQFSDSERPSEPEEMKKFYTKLLNDWKTEWKAAHDGKGPGQSDIESDPTVKFVFDEFSLLKKGTHPLQQQKQPQPEEPVAAAVAPVDEAAQHHDLHQKSSAPPISESHEQHQHQNQNQDPEERKKELASLLAEWKTAFKASHGGKGPSQSDIDADPQMKILYDEYVILKKGSSKSELHQQPQEEEKPHQHQQQPEKSKSEQEPQAESPEDRKKYLTKTLGDWKNEFKRQNGRGPKQADIDADENISKIYVEYMAVKKSEPSAAAVASAPEPSKKPIVVAEDENKQQNEGPSADDMKKQCAKQLADWKSNFKEANGKNPKQSDIEQDAETNIIFQQYTILKNGGTVEEANLVRANALAAQNPAPAASSPKDSFSPREESPQVVPSGDALEDRKKQLAKILANWKSDFRSIHNKNPSQNDVMSDPEIREVYEEYSCLKSGRTYIPPPPPPALQTQNQKGQDDVNNNNNNNTQIMNDGNNDQQNYSYQGQIDMNNVAKPVDLDENANLHGGAGGVDDDHAHPPEERQGLLRTESSIGFGYRDDRVGNGDAGQNRVGGFLRWLGGDESESDTKRMDNVTHEHHVKLWENASARHKIFSMLEPSCGLVQPYASYQIVTGLYQLIYIVLLISYVAVSLAETVYGDGVTNVHRMLFVGIPNMWFTFDFVLRAATCTEWQFVPMIAIDLLSLVTCWYALSNRAVLAGGLDVIRILPPLRILRLMLFTRLFVRKEFFRDIEIALLTVQASLTPLFLFAVLSFVFVLLFSTFIFLTERGTWNDSLAVWERPCRAFVSPDTCIGTEKSPFQSIPDGLWLTIQVLTTSGFGDSIPTTFWGRVVTGIAMIVGVFAIAFPTMLFIGNLEQVRKDYYAQLEKERIERSYRLDMIKILQDQQAAIERANIAKAELTMDLGATMNAAMNATMNATMNFATLGMKVKRDSNMVLFDETVNDEIPAQPLEGPAVAVFSFMGSVARPIKKTRRGEFIYEPIMEFLCDPQDGGPILSSVAEIDTGVFMAQLTLIIDDLVAQELAAEAIFDHLGQDDAPTNGAAPRATGVYNLDVALSSPLDHITVHRRIDASRILENAVPVTIEINAADLDDVYDAQSAKDYARANLAGNNANFTVSYSRAPIASAIWQKSVPITSIMLSTTPFIHDLLEIATRISVADLIADPDSRKLCNAAAKRRRHVAFVSHHDIPELVFPVFRKVVGQSRYVIRNAAHFVEALTHMVTLHCRRVRHHEIPESLRSSVYNGKNKTLSEELMEVDLDYFRSVDWPLGTVVVEFAEMRGKITCSVPVRGGIDCEQPIIADVTAYERVNILEKDSLHRLCTIVRGGGNENNFHGGARENDDNDDEPTLGMQNQHASFHRSNLFAQGISSDKKLAALLGPPVEFH